jgi:hypothetical protein
MRFKTTTIVKSLTALLALMPICSSALTLTVGNETYFNASLVKEFPQSLQIRHAGGSAFLKRSDLSREQLEALTGSSGGMTGKDDKQSAATSNEGQDYVSVPAGSTASISPTPAKVPLREGIEIDGSSMIAVTGRAGTLVSRVATTLDDSGNVAITSWANDLNTSVMKVPRSQAVNLLAHMNKYLEWENKSEKEGLENVSKQIGEVGDYDVVFEKERTGICKIVRKDDPSEDSLFSKSQVLYLVSMLDNLEKIEQVAATKRAEQNAMQKRADDVLR